MTINTENKIEVLAKNSRKGDNNQEFYNLAVMVNGEAGNINCTEDVYNTVQVRAVNQLIYTYNDRYKSFRAIAVVTDDYSGEEAVWA